MKITIQNYEHWFIDFIDGNLSPEDEAMVREFAKSKPDLNNELDNFMEFKIVPEQTSFKNKNLLKQNNLIAINGITKFEQLSIAYFEKEISYDEQRELNHFLNNYDKKKKEFELIQKIKLVADNSIKYQSKSSLKKLFITNKRIANYKFIYRIAAIFTLLIGLTFLFNKNWKSSLTRIKLANNHKSFKLRPVKKSKEFNVINFDNKTVIRVVQRKDKAKKIRQAEVLLKNLTSFECNYIAHDKNNKEYAYFKENSFSNTPIMSNVPTRKKTHFAKNALAKLKFSGKLVFVIVAKNFKKKFKYKKTFTDDGRTLIALKAGDFEYKISTKTKKSLAKELK